MAEEFERVYPAAVEQLRVLGEQIGIPVYTEATNPVQVCKNAIGHAKQHSLNVIILDTAGRLQIDQELMSELAELKMAVRFEVMFRDML
jgi:signal recognition particle subunit SRP54